MGVAQGTYGFRTTATPLRPHRGANSIIDCLNPAWSTFVGCHMNRNILADILAAGEWDNPGGIEVAAEDPYACLPRIWGVLKKKA